MRIGMVGLGRMGANMATRLLRAGHEVVVHDVNAAAALPLVEHGAVAAPDIGELVAQLDAPRVVWVMVPAGEPTAATIDALTRLLDGGDTIIDGGNSLYRDAMRRAAELREHGIHFVDAGTSGGIWGLREGYSLMIGGTTEAVEPLTPLFEALAPAPERGWRHVGPPGAGHFVKMVHNGIEYGMMQAYAEGFALLRKKQELELDLAGIAQVWQHGSVVRSWLLDLTAAVLDADPELRDVAPYVADSGEGRWTVAEAIDLDVPAPVITLSLIQRLRSRDEDAWADRLLAAMRRAFGGHAIRQGGAPPD